MSILAKHSAHTIGQYSSPYWRDPQQRWIAEAWEYTIRKALSLPVSCESLETEPRGIRLAGALLLEQNDEWQLQRRYMQLEGLNAVSDNQTARLSAVIS